MSAPDDEPGGGRPGPPPAPPVLHEDGDLVLAELVSRVLDRGVMVSGEVTISVAGIDLVQLSLRLRLVSTETLARQERRPSPPRPT